MEESLSCDRKDQYERNIKGTKKEINAQLHGNTHQLQSLDWKCLFSSCLHWWGGGRFITVGRKGSKFSYICWCSTLTALNTEGGSISLFINYANYGFSITSDLSALPSYTTPTGEIKPRRVPQSVLPRVGVGTSPQWENEEGYLASESISPLQRLLLIMHYNTETNRITERIYEGYPVKSPVWCQPSVSSIQLRKLCATWHTVHFNRNKSRS